MNGRSSAPAADTERVPAPPDPGATTTQVSAVVVCYRNAGDVVSCIAALENALAGCDGEIVLVDNASDDGTVEVLRRARPDLGVIARDVNDGFARGCHIGAQRSRGRWILFVNPDAVLEPQAVAELLDAARQHPGAGILGGRALRADGSTDPRSWWGRPTLWSTLCFATGLSSAFPGHRVFDPESADRWDGMARQVPVVSGALMLVDRMAWDDLGGFDRELLLYGEDVDLCLRARQAGWRPRVVPAATFRHSVGGSTPGPLRTVLVMRGRASVIRRHLPAGTRWLGSTLLVAGTGLRALDTRRRQTGRGTGTGPAGWRAAWNTRRRWTKGWQPGDRLPDVVAADAAVVDCHAQTGHHDR